MSNSNSSKDTVLLLRVGQSNSSRKKYPNLKRYIIRWFKGLKTLSIQKKIILTLIIMICWFLLYPIYHNQVPQLKRKAIEDLDLKDLSEINRSYNTFQEPALQNLMYRDVLADKIRRMKRKNE